MTLQASLRTRWLPSAPSVNIKQRITLFILHADWKRHIHSPPLQPSYHLSSGSHPLHIHKQLHNSLNHLAKTRIGPFCYSLGKAGSGLTYLGEPSGYHGRGKKPSLIASLQMCLSLCLSEKKSYLSSQLSSQNFHTTLQRHQLGLFSDSPHKVW